MTSPTPTPSRTRGCLGKLALTFGILVALVAAYALIAPAVYKLYLQRVLPREAAAAAAARSASWDETFATQLRAQAGKLGVTTEPVYVARYSTCYTDHSDAGWMVREYIHRCRVGDTGLIELPAGAEVDRLWAVVGPGVAEVDPDVASSAAIDGVVAYASLEATATRVLVGERGQSRLDPAKRYVVVTAGEEYLRRVIGCRPATPIFCDSPLG